MNDTLNWYDKNAELFFQSTNDAKMNAMQEHFLTVLKNEFGDGSYTLLDFGCGIGRDSLYFKTLGLQVTAIDGSKKMCELASKKTGLSVECMDFCAFDEEAKYDGIWACASLLHLEDTNLVLVMKALQKALVENGILYCSFKYGDTTRVKDGRFFNDYNEEKFNTLLEKVDGLEVVDCFVTNDVRVNREHEKWLNVFLRKVD